eukprot:jgi/Picre1/30303/NNA_005667.t1
MNTRGRGSRSASRIASRQQEEHTLFHCAILYSDFESIKKFKTGVYLQKDFIVSSLLDTSSRVFISTQIFVEV